MAAESVRLAPGRHRRRRGWRVRLVAMVVLVVTGYLVTRGLAGFGRPVLLGVGGVLLANVLVSWFVIEANQRREGALARLLAERPPAR
ncbi:MAG TPA: hypothetical protein VMB79_12840 [Jatrophihabitans sp.]|nr:hypothetical protein [Jatrophihabitans sp.]